MNLQSYSLRKSMRRTQKLSQLFRIPPATVLIPVASLCLLLDASLKGILFSLFLLAVAGCLIGAATLKPRFNSLSRWAKHSRQRKLALQNIPSLILLVTYFLSELTIAPANAQFLQNAEAFVTTLFAGSNVPATFVPLIFGVLRAIFVIYIAIAVIRVLVAARNDDDWVRAVA